jgi:hypothetical protein
MIFAFGFSVYCIGALECYPDVCFPEEIGNFPNFDIVVSECDPFFFASVGFLLCMFDFSFLMIDSGKLLLFAVGRIVYHFVFSSSGERGKDIILLIR